MYYENYLSYILSYNDMIYIDTSTVMNTEAMRLFIQRAEEEFIIRNKRMIITQWVYKELIKHTKSDNENKSKQAREALLLLEEFQNIFILEEEHAFINNATFADSDLLSKLTLNKASSTQLLITSDRALALDAYNLNNQNSNRGRKVMVCHINRAGYIKKCDCVNMSDNESNNVSAEPEVIVKEKIIYVNGMNEEKLSSNTVSWKLPVAIAGGFAGGIIFEKVAVPFIKKALIAA